MQSTLRALYRYLPPVLWIGSALACAHIVLKTPEPGILRLTLIALLSIGAFLGSLFSRHEESAEGDSRQDPSARQSMLLALGFWATAIPVTFALYQLSVTAPPPDGWNRYPYLDKRWLIFLFWTTVLAVLWTPLVLLWLRRQADGLLTSLKPSKPIPLEEAAPTKKVQRRHFVLLLVAFAISTLAYGPPWNVEWSKRPVNPHETLHWGGLQSIDRGNTPYVGPASVNYGPGAQLAMYAYIDATDQMTLPGIRETFAVALWIAVFLFCSVALLALPGPQAALAILAMFVMSPAASWGWTPQGVLHGFYGWANLLRNIATLVLSFGIYALVRLGSDRRTHPIAAAGIGVLWGLFAYYSQENLFGGVLIIGFLIGIAVAGDLITLQNGIKAGLLLCLGFSAVWAPVIVFYLSEGSLSEVIHNYFLVPSRFMKGYANTPYTGTLDNDQLAVAFYVTPFFALMIGAVAVFKTRPLRPAFPLSPERFLVVSMTVAYLAAYPSGLLRSDAPHFQSTTFAVPILLVLAALGPRSLKSFKHFGIRRLAILAVVIFIAVLTYLPSWLHAPKRFSNLAKGRLASFHLAEKPFPELPGGSEIARRYGAVLANTPRAKPNLEIFAQLKAIVGEDPVMVFVDVPYGKKPGPGYTYEGFVYFLADLHAGPIIMERSDMVAGQADLDRFLQHFEQRIDQFHWLVSLAKSSEEIRIFTRAYPCHTIQTLESEGTVLYLFGKGPIFCQPEPAVKLSGPEPPQVE